MRTEIRINFTGTGLELQDFVNRHALQNIELTGLVSGVVSSDPADVIVEKAVRNNPGNKLEAIKAVRAALNIGLKEAKDAVEACAARIGLP